MPLIPSVAVRNAYLTQVQTLLDAGAAAGYIEVRTGSQPASPAAAATGTLLVTIDLPDPSFGAPSAGVATSDPASVDAVADGTAGWWRAYDSDGTAVLDGACGLAVAVDATAADDVFTTASAHGLAVGKVVNMRAGITGVAAGAYVVVAVPSSTTFKLAPYGSSTPVDVTADGSATYGAAAMTLSTLTIVTGAPVDAAITLRG